MLKSNQNAAKNDRRHQKFKYNNWAIRHIQPSQRFCTITFNKDKTILFIGGPLKIIGFNNKQKLLLTLQGEGRYVLFLVYIKKFNQLASQNLKSIIFWNQDKNNLWKPHIILKENCHISCQIINKEKSLFIYATSDEKIKFCKKINSIWGCFWTIDSLFIVSCLSLSISNTKLIFCFGRRIGVIEYQGNKEWIMMQTIQNDYLDCSPIFINDNQFVLQPSCKRFLEFYIYQQETNQFYKDQKKVQVERSQKCCLAHDIWFIEQKNILIVQQGCQFEIFSITQKGEVLLQQRIYLKHNLQNFGSVTDDRKYLAVLIGKDKFIIQVRKLQYLE